MDATEMQERINNGEDALEVSILKWEDILEEVEDSKCYHEAVKVLSGRGGDNCALCYVNDYACGMCLVQEKTGRPGCNDTPFRTICTRYNSGFYNSISSIKLDVQAEIDFLKSLRVPDKPKIKAKRGQVYRLHCGGYGEGDLVIIQATSDGYIANGFDGCYWGISEGQNLDHVSKWLEDYNAELVFDSLKDSDIKGTR